MGIYAVMKAGGAYVPIDPDQPARAGGICAGGSGPGVGAGDAGRIGRWCPQVCRWWSWTPLMCPASRLIRWGMGSGWRPLRPGNAAYVIFTSGSTGLPKGVAVPHEGDRESAVVDAGGVSRLDSTDVVLQKTPVTFDVSVWELFWPLHGRGAVGGRGAGRASGSGVSGAGDCRAVGDDGAFRAVDAGGVPWPARRSARARACGGCSRRVRRCRRRRRRGCVRWCRRCGLHNLYGPTEAAVDVTFHEVTGADTVGVPIGAPVWNTRVFVLDGRLRPVPVGVAGELYLGGVQLARGYRGSG